MAISNTSVIERIARVLAARNFSANAEGTESSAGDAVDDLWREYEDDALAILRTLREPDPVMARAGDPVIWEAMVRAVLEPTEVL